MKEKAELASLPGHIEALEAEQTQLHALLADPGFFRQPGAETTRVTQRIAALGPELDAAYQRWDTLEAKAAAARTAAETRK
jgi:ATP-binding cassette subfamily F protein uup